MAANGSNYKASATEFGKRLTALYKIKIFPRMGSEFADKLFKSAVEAGANISALGDLSDADSKVKVACDAIVKLNEVAFAVQIMVEGGFYTADEVAPLSAYIEKLVEALSKLVASIKARQSANGNVRPVQSKRHFVIEQKPVVHSKVIVRSSDEILKEAQAEMDKAQANKAEDVKVEGAAASVTAETPQAKQSGGNGDPDGLNAPYNN